MKKAPPVILLIGVMVLTACAAGHGTVDKTMAGYNLPKTRPDPVAERRIVFLHPESGERLDINYFHGGQYDAKALKKIDYLFRDRHVGVVGEIDPELIDYLVDIRTRFNLPSSVTFEV